MNTMGELDGYDPGSSTRAPSEPIALIGIGCRFPGGVHSTAEYWNLLCGGVDAITEVPSYRWDIDALYDPDPAVGDKIYSRAGGFLGPVEDFDAKFFGISPREAASLDPQQRLLLETSWEAIEHAHLPADRLFGSETGVFLGISTLDNGVNLSRFADPKRTDAYYGTGNSMSGAAGRLSYAYGLKGPCMAVETACSSSLVAVHLARRSLLDGECDIAIAAGVNLMLAPDNSIVFSRARMLAPDGRCKTFSEAADGYGRGEGCGVVILEPLSRAVSNGRRIIALIRGTAVNQDGASGGLTVPNGPAQQAVIRRALQSGGVDPALVGYVETHGTGTPLGDPIEVNALGAVFGKHRSQADPLIVGTVKTNIGHLEAAAGIAGLIKLALALQHAQIPASLHFDQPNRNIPWHELPVRVATTLEPWPRTGTPRVGGVSSFGFAGTNAHVVMEEPPPPDPEPVETELPCRLLALSAKTDDALKDLAVAYERFLAARTDDEFAHVCGSANTGRTHFKQRISVVASSATEASRTLAHFRAGQIGPGVATGTAAGGSFKVAFLCSGQGAQYPGMGRQLYETQPVFRGAIDECAFVLRAHLERPLLEVLYGGEQGSHLVDQTAYTQPALFALEYAVAKLWDSWGIRPTALMGHSVGEYVAACLAGVFSLADGLGLVARRGQLMQALPTGGGMVAVLAEENRVRAAIGAVQGEVAVAAVNGPRHTVVSGRSEVLETVLAPLAAEGVRLERLNVSHAFHSPLMEPMVAEFRQAAERITYSSPRLTLISNVTGEPVTARVASADYWVDHLRQAVKFSSGMEYLRQKSYRIFVEIGPQPVLLAMGAAVAGDDCVLVPSLRRAHGDVQQIFRALGTLYAAGAAVDWEGFERGKPRPRAVLPSYPFQRERHWPHNLSVAELTTQLKRQGPSTVANLLDDLYRLEWRPLEPHTQPEAPARTGTWVIFADSGGVGQGLAGALRPQGQRCTLVYRDGSGQRADGDSRRIDPSRPDQFGQLLAELSGPLREVVYLWNLDGPPAAEIGLLHLVQALTAGESAQTRLWVVTRGAVNAGAQPGPVELSQAPSWGLGRVIALEHPEVWGGLIDLDPAASAESIVEGLVALCSQTERAEQVAFRGGQRLEARLTRTAPPEAEVLELRSDATYLIAGGLGELGLGLARWMASQGARNLVLTSRSGPTERTRAQIRGLESMGVTVLALAADVASETDMARVFADVARALPPVRGIVHTAGVLDDGILRQQSQERFTRVMAPKVAGAWNLHHLSADLELDFFVLFSSTASLLGSPGQGNYAAANAYLDALAEYRRACGQPALSINWGPWSQLGMAAALGEGFRKRLESRGVRFLGPAQAFQVFGKLLRASVAQVAVMPVDWSTFRRQLPAGAESAMLADLLPAETADEAAQIGRGRYALELRSVPAHERGRLLTTYLQERIAEVLGMAPPELPPLDQGFADMGMDSLMTLDLKGRLEHDLGIPFSPGMVFNYPTIESLGPHLRHLLGLSDGLTAELADAPSPIDAELVPLEEIRNSSDEELAAFIAREYDAHQ